MVSASVALTTGDRSDGRHLRHRVCYIREPTCQPCREYTIQYAVLERAGRQASAGWYRRSAHVCQAFSYKLHTGDRDRQRQRGNGPHPPSQGLPHSDRCRMKRGCLLHPQRLHRTQGRGAGSPGRGCASASSRKLKLASLGHTLVMGLHLAYSAAL